MAIFHDIHGGDIKLTKGGTMAEVTSDLHCPVVFSSQPLRPGERFTVKVDKAKYDMWVRHVNQV